MVKSIRTKVLDQLVDKYHGLKAVVKGRIICNNQLIKAVVIKPSTVWALALILIYNLKI